MKYKICGGGEGEGRQETEHKYPLSCTFSTLNVLNVVNFALECIQIFKLDFSGMHIFVCVICLILEAW